MKRLVLTGYIAFMAVGIWVSITFFDGDCTGILLIGLFGLAMLGSVWKNS